MAETVKDWVEKVGNIDSSANLLDLSRDEDLAIGIMNLISLEEHLFFTAMKTDDKKYIDQLDAIRKIRIRLLQRIVKDPKGEEWCMSKHLLAASMRIYESGTKELSRGFRKEAEELFDDSFSLFSLFFTVNMQAKSGNGISGGVVSSVKNTGAASEKSGILERSKAILKKMVDCCKEW